MIGPVGPSGIAMPQGVKPKPAGGTAVAKPVPVTPSVTADIAAQGAPVDASRVAELRSAIAQGTYKVDAHAIADAMIAADTTR